MFGILKKKSKLDKLQDTYTKLLEQSNCLSKSNKSESDKFKAESLKILHQIEVLQLP